MRSRIVEILRAASQALVIGVFPLVAGIMLDGRLARLAFGDWLNGLGPFLGGLLVALLQETARAPAAALLGWLGGRLLGPRATSVVLASMAVGYLYEVLLRLAVDTAVQLGEPGYLLGRLLGAVAVCLLAIGLIRRVQRNLLDRSGKHY